MGVSLTKRIKNIAYRVSKKFKTFVDYGINNEFSCMLILFFFFFGSLINLTLRSRKFEFSKFFGHPVSNQLPQYRTSALVSEINVWEASKLK